MPKQESDRALDRDAMIRWQAYARDSRTSVNSHFLAYTAAILALLATVLLDAETKKIDWPQVFAIAGVLAVLSLTAGSLVVLVRLRDARLTARVARYRYTNKPQQEIDDMRKKADFYSGLANKLLPLQVISFTLSAILTFFWVAGAHLAKLFGISS